jgi:hypothetical protein
VDVGRDCYGFNIDYVQSYRQRRRTRISLKDKKRGHEAFINLCFDYLEQPMAKAEQKKLVNLMRKAWDRYRAI